MNNGIAIVVKVISYAILFIFFFTGIFQSLEIFSTLGFRLSTLSIASLNFAYGLAIFALLRGVAEIVELLDEKQSL